MEYWVGSEGVCQPRYVEWFTFCRYMYLVYVKLPSRLRESLARVSITLNPTFKLYTCSAMRVDFLASRWSSWTLILNRANLIRYFSFQRLDLREASTMISLLA